MLVSINWINDFVDLSGISPGELRERFTRCVAEVEKMETKGAFLEDIRIAKVTEVEPHPNANKLHLVTFDLGEGEAKKVVCGAPNVRVGLKSPFAPVGSCLPGGLRLEAKAIRGVLSQGMLCSEKELGYSEEAEGIMELPAEAPVGVSLKEYFGQKADIVLHIDNKSLTHRPDLWGHRGLAQEFAAVFGRKLQDPYGIEWKKKLESSLPSGPAPMALRVDSDSSCLAYFGLSLEGVTVAPSPPWMVEKLEAVNLRSINNIVDVSNVVMMEFGMPLHIFDRDKIEGGQVVIERLKGEEVFQTLDHVQRKLVPADTIIRDAKGPLVLAGIMGGLGSSVSEETTDIFIEVANWKAHEVRKTSLRLGLRSDSSERYEKGLDSHQCYRTLLRTLELILQLCPKARVAGQVVYDGKDLSKGKKTLVATSPEAISKALGLDIPRERILEIFRALDFQAREEGESLLVEVPTYRATKDIECEADLVEEIGRIVGYNNITPSPPLCALRPVGLSPFQILKRKAQDFLTCHAQAFEVMAYPLIGPTLLAQAQLEDKEELLLANALSRDHDRMCPSLLPGLLKALGLNAKHRDECRFFEWGRAYKRERESFCREEHHLGLVFYSSFGHPFMDLVNTCERALTFMGVPATLRSGNTGDAAHLIPKDWPGFHPFEQYTVGIMGQTRGIVFSLHPNLLRSFKAKGRGAMMLVDLSILEKKRIKSKKKYRSLPKFPSSTFDYCLEVDKDRPVGTILACLKKIKMKEIVSHTVVDVYEDEGPIKYVTLRSTLFDETRTLPGSLVKEAEERIVTTLKEHGYPLKRG